MRMEKRTFRIGELTRVLSQDGIEIDPPVIRFWEREFDIQPKRSTKGQRYYDERDLSRFLKIRELLYEKRFTIQGARQALSETNTEIAFSKKAGSMNQTEFIAKLGKLRYQLENLKKLL